MAVPLPRLQFWDTDKYKYMSKHIRDAHEVRLPPHLHEQTQLGQAQDVEVEQQIQRIADNEKLKALVRERLAAWAEEKVALQVRLDALEQYVHSLQCNDSSLQACARVSDQEPSHHQESQRASSGASCLLSRVVPGLERKVLNLQQEDIPKSNEAVIVETQLR